MDIPVSGLTHPVDGLAELGFTDYAWVVRSCKKEDRQLRDRYFPWTRTVGLSHHAEQIVCAVEGESEIAARVLAELLS